MFRNYVATALRNLLRNRLYAVINIVGLTVGFAAALLIALFVRDEFSYDKWLPNAANIYMLTSELPQAGQPSVRSNYIPAEIAPALKLDFPGIDKAVRLLRGNAADLRHLDGEFRPQLFHIADPGFFDVIQFPVLAGDLKTALDAPDSVVITLSAARKYFGKDAPIGEMLERRFNPTNVTAMMKVTAVIQDLPSNTQFNTEVIFSTRALSTAPPPAGQWASSFVTYFTLKPGTSIDEISHGLPDFVARHFAGAVFNSTPVGPTPLSTLLMTGQHLGPGSDGLNPRGDRDTIAAIAAIGVLILFTAAVNFVNLTTARATQRAVEVGVRKTTGAAKLDLMIQFLGESLLTVAFGMMSAMVTVNLTLPAFNGYLTDRLSLNMTSDAYAKRMIAFDFWADPVLLAGIVGIVIFVGVAAGAYPAFVLSRFHPKAVLKSGSVKAGALGHLRGALVILQFAILIGLVLSALTMYRQMDYALRRGTNLDTARVMSLRGACAPAMQDTVRALPGVEGAGCTGSVTIGPVVGQTQWPLAAPNGVQLSAYDSMVDVGTLEFFGIKPIAGRLFADSFPGDRTPDRVVRFAGQLPPPPGRSTFSVVVNEALARGLSPGNPAAAVGMTMGWRNDEIQVVGVVPDFTTDPIHLTTTPTFYYLLTNAFMPQGTLHVRLRPGADESATLAAIDKTWKEFVTPGAHVRYSVDEWMQFLNAGLIRRMQAFAVFAAIAVFVGVLGLFGLAAFTAERCTKEIGIRKTMGATRIDILRLLLSQFAKPVLWANLIAWPTAYVFMRRWLEGFAYHIDLSPWMFLAASALALVIAIATVIGHALLVARAQPVTALRYE